MLEYIDNLPFWADAIFVAIGLMLLRIAYRKKGTVDGVKIECISSPSTIGCNFCEPEPCRRERCK